MRTLLNFQKFPNEEEGREPEGNLYGVEFEFERVDARKAGSCLADFGWRLTSDGSLRNSGVEVLLRYPLGGQDLSTALDYVDKYLSVDEEASASARTSVHVHMDIRDLTAHQFFRLLSLYCIFEKVLYQVGGASRYVNNNCIPITEMDRFANILSCFKEERYNDGINSIQEIGKYAGLNIRSMSNTSTRDGSLRGSIEFRMHEGTRDIPRVRRWIGILDYIKKYAQSDRDILEYINSLSEDSSISFLTEVFQEYHPYMIYSGIEKDIITGFHNLEYINNFSTVKEFQKDLFNVSSKKKTSEEPQKKRKPIPPSFREFDYGRIGVRPEMLRDSVSSDMLTRATNYMSDMDLDIE